VTDNLAKLAELGHLKIEVYSDPEFRSLVDSARKRLVDARNKTLSPESRFDLAYNASHSLALAALRSHGYRSNKSRALVFQALAHTVGMDASKWRVLSKCHDLRNLAEYEGQTEVDERLLADLLKITSELETMVAGLRPLEPAITV
jgi:hypothetical protein